MSDGEHFSRKAIDNAGSRYKDNSEQASDRSLIQAYRAFRCEPLPTVFYSIVGAIKGQPALVSGRIKRVDTVIRKLRRERAMALTFMDDIVGFRIIVPSPQVQGHVMRALTEKLQVKATRDYVAHPIPSGYRAVHLIGLAPQRFPAAEQPANLTFEIQIRTSYQQLWSTISESFGEQVKEGGGTSDQRDYLKEFSDRIAAFEVANSNASQQGVLDSVHQTAYFNLIYDKPKGILIESYSHSDNLLDALRHYQYLENLHSLNFSKEVVLLCAQTGKKELEVTHARYYHYRGRPEIPDHIEPHRPLPE
jgi:ppGpp synthetase/RelA/SpoT-type nucleotidyltranferase